MNEWDKRRREIGEDADFDPLTTIPMLEFDNDVLNSIKLRIRKEFDSKIVKNIVVIDPYFGPADIGLITSVFGSVLSRTITVVTNLESVEIDDESDDQSKEDIANKMRTLVAELKGKQVFNDFLIFKTNAGIHDRMLFSPDIGCSSLFFVVGASYNMLFKKYSYIVRVTNASMRYKMIQLFELYKKQGYQI
jgi:hypothetical protein